MQPNLRVPSLWKRRRTGYKDVCYMSAPALSVCLLFGRLKFDKQAKMTSSIRGDLPNSLTGDAEIRLYT